MKKRTVFRGKFLTVQQWRHRLPGGQTMLFEQVKRPSTVIVLPVEARQSIVLTRERRPGIRTPVWHVPAGRVDDGETVLAAAKRELAEEVQLRARRWKKVFDHTSQGIVRWRRIVFVARDLASAERIRGDPGEEIRPVRMPLARAHQLARSGAMYYPEIAYHIIRLWNERARWLT